MEKFGLHSLSLKAFTFKKEEPKKINFKTDEIKKVGKTVIGYYKEDINITDLHHMILDILKEEKEELLKGLSSICEIEKKNLTGPQCQLDRKFSIGRLSSSLKQIKELEANVKIDQYNKEIKDLVIEYQKIGSLKKVRVLGKDEIKMDENNQIYIKRHSIIEEFITKASKYVTINLIRKIGGSQDMVICDKCYTYLNPEEYSGLSSIVCYRCNLEMPKLLRFTEDVSENMESKIKSTDYQDLGNFEEAINKYMGLSYDKYLNINDLIENLDKYFEENSLILGSQIKSNYKFYSSKYNRKLMRSALKHIGYNHLYSDIQYIMNLYWGKPLKDIYNLKDQLIEDYRLSQPFYEKYKSEDKSSSMNVQYRLWKHLRRLNHECDKNEDFNIPIASFDYYETIWSKMCIDLEWENKS